MELRTSVLEECILPSGFGGKFKNAIFPVNGTESEEASIEKLINGVANSCKNEPKDNLEVIFDCNSDEAGLADPNDLIDLCYLLSIASDILVSKSIDEKEIKEVAREKVYLHGLKKSLSKEALHGSKVTKEAFVHWASGTVPFLHACITTFTHNLIFHGKSNNKRHGESFVNPELLDSSNIFTSSDPSLLFAISCMAPNLGGKWRRLYSSKMEETPVNNLKYAITEHVGPSIFIIKTADGSIFGGCSESFWKFCYFLFEIEPVACVYNIVKSTSTGKFYVNHDETIMTEKGEFKGYGFYADDDDATKWDTSHIFFSYPTDICFASFLAKTPVDVDTMEIWGLGTDLYE